MKKVARPARLFFVFFSFFFVLSSSPSPSSSSPAAVAAAVAATVATGNPHTNPPAPSQLPSITSLSTHPSMRSNNLLAAAALVVASATAGAFANSESYGNRTGASRIEQFGQKMDFLIIGDWGQQKDFTDMVGVAKYMDKWAAYYDSKLVVSLGDNFYKGGNYSYDGVLAVNDTKFDTLWSNVYSGPTLSTLPWWFILGNHDWYENKSNVFEMEFAQKYKNSWFQPSYFYTRRVKIGGVYASFIFIETDLLFYGYPGKNSMPYNFKAAGWNATANTVEKQLAWIDKALETANPDEYVFVVGHHPCFTCASDVASSSYMLNVLDIVNKWKPTAYINGHHHTAAYYFTNGGKTLQLQIGNGGNADAACAPVDPSAVGFELANTYGFGHARITETEFRIDFVTELGEVALSTLMMPRTPVEGVTANVTFLVKDCDPAVAFLPTC
ncbi:Metallo-dependent phosphatase-like protein [Zopfochytrium polystomum]|nr:Metallo-dependent phosphatase-like protein [Zopfochytrium polystomum]